METVKNETEIKKDPLVLNKLILDLESPLEMKADVELQNLTLFVGLNNSGKSFILKTSWVINYAIHLISRMVAGKRDPLWYGTFDFIIKHSYYDYENLNGSIKAEFNHGFNIAFKLKKGIVEELNIENFNLELVKHYPCPQFLSTNYRLFSNINHYLYIRSLVTSKNKELNHAEMENLLKTKIPLYDIMFLEKLIAFAPFNMSEYSGITTFEESAKMGSELANIVSIDVDLEKSMFFATLKDGSIKDLATYSNGNQSIINMFLLTPKE